MTIGWGIIGIGDHSDRMMAPALVRAANTRFVSVCSRSLERAQNFAAKHGAERSFDSLDKMLEDPDLDVLYIATPNNLHARQTIQAAEAGKHILCEKPMALNASDCELMLQACDKNKVKLAVCFQNRYHPAHIEAKRYIQSGLVGDINVAKVQYCRDYVMKGWRTDPSIAGAGALMGQGVHCVDLLRYLLDSEVAEIRAMTDEEPPKRPVDEMVYVIFKFENGIHATMIAGVRAPRSDNDVVLYGSKAKVTCTGTVGLPRGSLGQLSIDGDVINVKMDFPSDVPVIARNIIVVEAFNKCIEDNTEMYISGYNGMQMVKIEESILESSRQGKAIKMK
ncbi:Gfo/Idh/MocA family protein [Chloroflexota bacterium]